MLRGTKVVAKLAGSRTAAVLRVRAGAYRVRAVDPAGNVGAASSPITVRAVKRPASLPARIPVWAPRLLAWQLRPHPTRGPRPSTPAHLPSWFWTWRAWQLHVFTVSG